MQKKIQSVLSGAGFYVVLALCVLVVGAGGYFLLFPRGAQPPPAPVSAPAPTVEAPAVEAVRPGPIVVETPVVPMPEEEVVDDTPVVAEAPNLVVAPLKGEVLAAFSMEELAYSRTLEDWRVHDGVDIAAQAGTTVLAACAGTVHSVTDDALMGTTVVIDHSGGYQTTYANLQSKPNVDRGDSVSAGQIIGAVGTTSAAEAADGPHLHFSVTRDGDALDPNVFLDQ
ncbi:MAG: M23 family metallopeptidase [Oscillibacter sp.]